MVKKGQYQYYHNITVQMQLETWWNLHRSKLVYNCRSQNIVVVKNKENGRCVDQTKWLIKQFKVKKKKEEEEEKKYIYHSSPAEI